MSKPRSVVAPLTRSRMMRSIRKTDTGPERRVRSLLTQLGIRYRLYGHDLPGSPDVVCRGRRKVVFVHGCFWHQHEGCRLSKQPSARPEYWLPKLQRNKERDKAAIRALTSQGWRVLVVWECELADEGRVRVALESFFCEEVG